MSITISHPTGILQGAVVLPASKSESNRLLIIRALSQGNITVSGLSDARDTRVLEAALASADKELNIGDAGTAMRFLTAYCCAAGQHKILGGSHRMCERPIGILVDALRDIGFHINYLQNTGYPPVEILPADMASLKNEVHIAGNISSQYISALLMIAPVLPGGLKLYFDMEITSRPYIELTLDIMAKAGIAYEWVGDAITIIHQKFASRSLSPAKDWSSASYWFAMAALAKKADVRLSHLSFDTVQGDKKIAEWMAHSGVKTEAHNNSISLHAGQSENPVNSDLLFNFSDNPDLAQTVIVVCAAMNSKATFTGLESLRIKETDRIAALQNELVKFGVELIDKGNGIFGLSGEFKMSKEPVKTYNDHRMAMAFAPLALPGEITIETPEVVDKSYPDFWEGMKELGFLLKQLTFQTLLNRITK